MSLSDPIGDMIARIKNAQQRNQRKVELPSSKFKIKIVDVFFEEENVKLSNEWSVFKKLFKKSNISRKECLKLPFNALSKALKK